VRVTTRGSEGEIPIRWGQRGFLGANPLTLRNFTAFFQKLRIFTNILAQISAETRVF